MIRSSAGSIFFIALVAASCPQAAVADDSVDILSGPWPTISGVTATGNSAVTAAQNPAGMSRFHKKETIARLAVAYSENEQTGQISELDISASETDDNVIGIPAIYHTRPLSDKWDFGFSVTAPAGFGDDYGDGDIRRYFATEWSLFYLAISTSVSYRVNDKLSIGGTVSANYSSYEIDSKVVNVDSPGTNDGDSKLEADGVSTSFVAGMMYEFNSRNRMGLVYRSSAESDLEDTPEFSNLSPNTEALIEASGRLDQPIEISSKLPPITILGFYHEFDGGVSLAADLAHIGWSDFKLTEFSFAGENLIQRNIDYDDALSGSLGLSIPYRPGVNLGVAVGFLESPVTDEERGLLFRVDDSWVVGFGVELERPNNRAMTISLNYGQGGDGRVTTGQLPILGEISSEYDSRDFLILDFKYKWR